MGGVVRWRHEWRKTAAEREIERESLRLRLNNLIDLLCFVFVENRILFFSFNFLFSLFINLFINFGSNFFVYSFCGGRKRGRFNYSTEKKEEEEGYFLV